MKSLSASLFLQALLSGLTGSVKPKTKSMVAMKDPKYSAERMTAASERRSKRNAKRARAMRKDQEPTS